MSVYDSDTDKDAQNPRSFTEERMSRAGYRPGWTWIPVAVTGLLIILVIATGFIYGGYNDSTRGFDNGTRLEQTGGDTTMPSLPTPVGGEGAPETGGAAPLNRPVVRPEEAPPIANDGQ